MVSFFVFWFGEECSVSALDMCLNGAWKWWENAIHGGILCVCVLIRLFYEFPVKDEVRCKLDHPLFLLSWQHNASERTHLWKVSHLLDIKLTKLNGWQFLNFFQFLTASTYCRYYQPHSAMEETEAWTQDLNSSLYDPKPVQLSSVLLKDLS